MYRYRTLDKASRIFCIWVGFIFCSEAVAFYAAWVYKDNLAVYGVSTLLQTFLVCIYFNYSIETFRQKNIGIWMGLTTASLGFYHQLVCQPQIRLDYHFVACSGLITIGVCLYALLRLLNGPDSLRLASYPHFWFQAILIAFWTLTLLLWTSLDYMSSHIATYAKLARPLLIMVNILTYSAVSSVFLLYPKMVQRK